MPAPPAAAHPMRAAVTMYRLVSAVLSFLRRRTGRRHRKLVSSSAGAAIFAPTVAADPVHAAVTVYHLVSADLSDLRQRACHRQRQIVPGSASATVPAPTAAADPVRIVGAAQRAGSAQDTCQSHACQGHTQQGTGKHLCVCSCAWQCMS